MMVLLGREGAGKLLALEHQGMVTSAILLDIILILTFSNISLYPQSAGILRIVLKMGGYKFIPDI